VEGGPGPTYLEDDVSWRVVPRTWRLTSGGGWSGTDALLTERVVKLLVVERVNEVVVLSRATRRLKRFDAASRAHLITPTKHARGYTF